MRKLILALLVSSACYMVHAQNDFVTRMNEIKMSGEYYTAHNRADTEEAAFEKCVKDIMVQLPPGIYDEAFVRKNAMRLTKPGGPCRVFAYLKKGTAPQKKEEMSQIVFKRDLQLEEAEDNHEIKPRPDTPKPIAPKPQPAKVEGPAPKPAEETKPVVQAGEGTKVCSPLPGTITTIPVKVGDAVAVGDTVCVLEAMKMQNNIEAENAGTITSIMVKEGETVMEGAVLVTIA